MNDQDLKTIGEIKKDFQEILDAGEKFFNLLQNYKNTYGSFIEENIKNLEVLSELIELNKKGKELSEKLSKLT